MTLDDLIHKTSEWLNSTGPDADIVTSSRIRLARNLRDVSFTNWASKKELEAAQNTMKQTVEDTDYFVGSLFLRMADLDNIDKGFLIERHIISRDHAVSGDAKAVVVDSNEIVSLMINEEDHIRLQVMQSGLNLIEAWRIADRIDTALEARLDYAYSADLGYLTACPTNAGTGMRASCMLHLPALVMSKQIGRLLQTISKLSLNARGLFGEGTEAKGNFFQISNQVSLGHTEDDIIDSLSQVIRQVVEQERNARRLIMKQQRAQLEDKVWRAYGTLKSAYIMTSDEALQLVSLLRLGADVGIVKEARLDKLNELSLLIQPAHLQKSEGRPLSPAERDVKRALLIRGKLG